VTGAAGYLGRYVVRSFKREGYWIRVLVRNPKGLEERGVFLEPSIKKYVDEIICGDIAQPLTLTNICKDIDIVISPTEIMHSRNRYLFIKQYYNGNKYLFKEAIRSSVKKVIIISFFYAERYNLKYIKQSEHLTSKIRKKLKYAIIRPTAFFSDMTIFLKMAQRGYIYLVGEGEKRINPIHGEDLAKICLSVAKNDNIEEVNIGGPEIYTYKELAKMAFKIIKHKENIIYISPKLANFIIKFIKVIYPSLANRMEFFNTVLQTDVIAPKYGTHLIKDYYQEIVARSLPGKYY